MKTLKNLGGIGPWLVALGLLITLSLPCRVAAQIDRGEITGTVEDPSGAVVPNVRILLTNDATGVTAATQSTNTGTYVFGNLLPATYTVQAESAGFEKYVVRGLYVHVQQVLTADVHLSTGNVEQNVTVTAAAPLLQAENAALGQTITNQAVNDLPLVTRDWGSLAQLSAGVSTAPPGQPTPDSGSTASAYFSVNGVNVWQNDFRLDGINDNIEVYGGNYTGTNAAIVPPPDAVQEFKVQNGDFNAEFGHSTGGVVNAAVKSGTNSVHGDLWEYVRNDAFNANYFFNSGKPVPEYRQNLFGGTIGGPVLIPRVYNGKNKTFWFFDYQGGRYILPIPATSTVPTTGMVDSGFTNLQDLIKYNSGTGTDALGRVFPHGTVLDPATTRALPATGIDPVTGLTGTPGAYVRDPFYNCTTGGCPSFLGNNTTNFTSASQEALLNVLPKSRLDPNAVKLLGVYPAQTSAGLTNNFLWVPKESHDTNTYDIRIDENINEKNILFGVFNRSLYTTDVPSSLPGLAVGETGGRTDSLPAYAWAVGYTRIFTPTLTNEMHVGMVHSDKLQQSVYGNTFGIPAQYGILGTQQVANNGGIPPITINGLTHIGVGNYTPTLQYVWSVEGADAVTKVYRSHTFKTGLQIDDLEGDISQPPQGRGDFNFNGQYTDIPNKNSSLTGVGDLLLTPTTSIVVGGVNNVGGMSSFSGSNIAATDDHRWYWGAFFQDDWKTTPNLTLNLGVRWDYFTPYAETRGFQANFVPTGGNSAPGTYYMSTKGCAVARSAAFNALLTASNITLNCVPDLTLGHAQKTNFAPRVGFAYRLKPNLVVRGGFGTAYGALGNLGYGGTLGTNYPFVYVQTVPSADSQHPILLPNGQPATMEAAFTQYNFQDPTINSGQGLSLYGRQYNFQTPYIETQNLTIQDQFTNHDSIQIGYVGTEGRHLDNLGYSNGNTQILPPGQNAQTSGGIPFPSFARNATYETTNATSSYNSLQATYEHQLSSGLWLLANYTWSKCMTDQHTQAEQNQQYRAEWLPGFGIARDYAVCDTDATHLVHVAGSWDLPFGHGRQFGASANKAVDTLLGGWVVSGIYSFQSGQPFTVGCPTPTTADFGCFANLTGQSLYSGPHNYHQWLNPSAFAQPPVATTAGQVDYSPLGGSQEQVRGPHYANLDSSVMKNFHFTEAAYLQFRAEAFNTTNTPPFAQPGQLNFTTANFSNISSTKNSNGNNGARTLQLALKLFY
ncbi:MAG TPA: TonB-dependent receptor [Terracidiphilus sp.]|nr:TonB-dependent receptor [Terracidiphilus sp.]